MSDIFTVGPDQPVILQCGVRKAGGKVFIKKILQVFKKIICQPDHDPLIGPAGADIGAVDVGTAGQQDITRAELVAAALNDIRYVPGQKEKNLIERMLMKFDHRRDLIVRVVKFVVSFRHNLAWIKLFFVHCSQKNLSGVGKYI